VLGVHTDAQQHIGQRLAQDLDDARRQHASAKERFDAMMREVPCGLPHGALGLQQARLQQAGQESRRALDVYSKALDRYSNFLLYGAIPKDLEP
jgi:hypothetical protein